MESKRCESCGSAEVGVHGMAIGGGWADLCARCADRLCACGAVVLKPGEAWRDALAGFIDLHTRERCTLAPGEAGVPSEVVDRGAGCCCDACVKVTR